MNDIFKELHESIENIKDRKLLGLSWEDNTITEYKNSSTGKTNIIECELTIKVKYLKSID